MATISSRLKEVTMEKIPNITSDMLDKLRELNINSVYQLAVQSPSELGLGISNVLDVELAAKLIGNARKTSDVRMKYYQENFQLQTTC